jgi:DNA (cytosine-5)-methyltransferase 1
VPGVPYSVIDLFAGCGGMSLGLVNTRRFRPVFAVEQDPHAAATYERNIGAHVECSKIEGIRSFPAADVIIGGPPCQGFSYLNRNRSRVLSRALWEEYARALSEVRPRAFIMENVPSLLGAVEFADFKTYALGLGYTVDEEVLNAADYGVPQRRRRAIVVGLRGGHFVWPEPSHGSGATLFEAGREPWVTFRDAVQGLPLVPDGENWHRSRVSISPRLLSRYEAVPPDGGNRFQMQAALERRGQLDLVPPCWVRKPTGTVDVGGRLWWDRPATTIRCEFYKPEKGRYLHPSEHRPITPREAARLMSFPDEFVFDESQSLAAVGRQIGNAVPPLLAQALATSLRRALDHADLAVAA